MSLNKIAKSIAIIAMKRTIMIKEDHKAHDFANDKIKMTLNDNMKNGLDKLNENQLDYVHKNAVSENEEISKNFDRLAKENQIDTSEDMETIYAEWIQKNTSTTENALRDQILAIDLNEKAPDDNQSESKTNGHNDTLDFTVKEENDNKSTLNVNAAPIAAPNVSDSMATQSTAIASQASNQNNEESNHPARPILTGINHALLSTVDRTLSSATAGKHTSFKTLIQNIEDYNDFCEKNERIAENKLIEANEILKRANASGNQVIPFHAKNNAATHRVLQPSYRKVEIAAYNVFHKYIALDDMSMFQFPVTVYEWDEPHPNLVKDEDVKKTFTFDSDALFDILWGISTGQNSATVGPPGCGKSVSSEIIAHCLGRPYYRIPCDGELTRREILGGMKAINGETIWYDGLLSQAIRYPSIIVLDEVDRVDPDLQYTLHQALERKAVTILEDEGRRIPFNSEAAFLCTANTMGKNTGDDNYQMRTELSEAIRDRINIWIKTDYLEHDRETNQIINDFPYIPQDTAAKIVKTANLMRNAYKTGTLGTVCSYRQIKTVCEYIHTLDNQLKPKTHKENVIRALTRILEKRAPSDEDEAAIKEMIALVN